MNAAIIPVITEKATDLATKGQYSFKVPVRATKLTVRRTIEAHYKVHVKRVNMVRMKGRARQFRKISGRTKVWKKAVVILKKGETLPTLA
ncbi:MAG: 50S ribosomal protein L23 [Parcubacteria group bacterium]|nr:50S ribosomal protein L23 [Parcubacteria group bacterium]